MGVRLNPSVDALHDYDVKLIWRHQPGNYIMSLAAICAAAFDFLYMAELVTDRLCIVHSLPAYVHRPYFVYCNNI